MGAALDGVSNACNASERYVMSTQEYDDTFTEQQKVNIFEFSLCSISDVGDFMTGLFISGEDLDCINRSPVSSLGVSSFATKSLEDQCQALHGTTSYICRGDDFPLDDFCTRAHCHTEGGDCEYTLPATGTCCGNGEYCLDGLCKNAPAGECADFSEECPFEDYPNCDEELSKCLEESTKQTCCRICKKVKSPPDPPSVTVNGSPISNNQQYNINFEETVDIQCSVEGGFPNVTKVTVHCPTMDVTAENGTSAGKTFPASEVNPPPTPPSITINGTSIANNGQLNVNLSQSLDMRCNVNGGYPSVSSTKIQCTGMEGVTQNGTSATTSFVASKEVNRAECVCSAHHISDNYLQTTSFTIAVFDPSIITGYSMGSETANSQTLQVIAGNSVLMTCEAHGIPAPSVSITKVKADVQLQGKASTSVADEYTKKFELEKTVGCFDSDTYRCVADNGGVDEKEFNILVKCSPKIKDNYTPLEEAKVTFMGQLEYTLEVTSYPAVDRFKLAKYEREEEDVTLIKEFNAFEFSVTSEYADRVNVVILKVFDLRPSDVRFYKLTLENGVEPPLVVSFTSSFMDDPSAQNSSPDSQVANVANLYIVASVAGLCLALLIIGNIVYIGTRRGKTARKKTKRSSTSQTQRTREAQNTDDNTWVAITDYY